MMDFEDAAQRLARDQQKLRGRRTVAVSAKAKREADYRKKQQEKMRAERQRAQRQQAHWKKYMTACDRQLGVKRLSTISESLQLAPTSIHGDGDKLALPSSVLEFLTAQEEMTSSPWMFRIGLVHPEYQYPQSMLLQTLKPDEEDDMSDDDDDHHNRDQPMEAYLDELAHKYITYTHGTVVEFTQEEGHVGLPAPIAAALIDKHRRRAEHQNFVVPLKRTQDPSAATASSQDEDTMNVHDDDDNKTPGHVAYGAFDVPDMAVEITMVRLPKGKGCTLKPTTEAIQNGFYNLQDVKMVLEQSLIRTRATLSVGDTVHTWHRGVKYDLTVSKVLPATYHAVTCINTDIEVDFEAPEQDQTTMDTTTTAMEETSTKRTGQTLSGGRTLSSSPTPPAAVARPPVTTTAIELIPEPPVDQKEGVCTIQIRGDGVTSSARRRFDIEKATLQDLFAFAASNISHSHPFQLVTRFPRKVYPVGTKTLAEAGISAGQELLMVERI
ncbi:Ubiquitin fusion degradation protein UFD1 [Seminavis robusta]|uniref:Ubiquitin fusion degradation protein UFD1 n=1 Tax=Seminavis robusta TaxID=568900 RepID=A0A9N8E233_9STRA|nr:Ubiquitin fusion degradation protein UFD1 [Seminavis robusta]|eukprot:Sro429_g141160.1 Ubiquitin fusion degradation protein UFD1 (496) ;mRNA; f:53681-55168